MATTPVRIPEDSYQELRETAIELDVSLSEAASIVLETGFRYLNTDEYIDLDRDLNQEFQESLPFESEQQALDKMDELQQRQRERNRERSELSPDPA